MNFNSRHDFESRWNASIAPRTGDASQEIRLELSEFLGLRADDVEAALADATRAFTAEWRDMVGEESDEAAIVHFYNSSKTELFDLARWHAEDPIHYRTLACCDIASRRPGRAYLDYGSGIGSDALVFANAGYRVTLADVSEPLLAFARWRFERRGLPVETIDLKRERPHAGRYDAAVCFDVLEHIPRPLDTIGHLHEAMREGGLLFLHAPFGPDAERPMHLVHSDVVSPKMPSIGFDRRTDLESDFPEWLWAPHVYQSRTVPALDRLGYQIRDRWLTGSAGLTAARWYRRLFPRGNRVGLSASANNSSALR